MTGTKGPTRLIVIIIVAEPTFLSFPEIKLRQGGAQYARESREESSYQLVDLANS